MTDVQKSTARALGEGVAALLILALLIVGAVGFVGLVLGVFVESFRAVSGI